jgi:regulator of replication initiation timing
MILHTLLHPLLTLHRDLANMRMERNALAKLVAISDAENTTLRAENDILRDELVEAEFALRRDPAAIYGAVMRKRIAA